MSVLGGGNCRVSVKVDGAREMRAVWNDLTHASFGVDGE